MAYPDARKSRALLLVWLAAVFSISALADLRMLAIAAAASLAVFWRGSPAALGKMAIAVLPFTVALCVASWGWLWLTGEGFPEWRPFAELIARTSLIAFVTFSALARINLLRALAPWPALTRLLVIALAQIHALRLLVTDSLLGLRSRLLRRPDSADLIRNAGGITGSLFTLTLRNASDITDAMRSRGFR